MCIIVTRILTRRGVLFRYECYYVDISRDKYIREGKASLGQDYYAYVYLFTTYITIGLDEAQSRNPTLASVSATGGVSLLIVLLTGYRNRKIVNCLFLKTTIRTLH